MPSSVQGLARPCENRDPGAGGRVEVVRVIARLNVGGPAQHVMNLSVGLADRYPTLLVAGQVDAGEAGMNADAEKRGIDLHTIPELGRRVRPWQDVVALVKLVRLLRRVRPRIVHTHTAKAGTLGRIAALVAGVPIRVHTFHGHVFRGYFGSLFTRLVVGIERMLARSTTRIVTISESQASEIVGDFRLCAREKVRVIPLGLDLHRFRADRMEALRGDLRREIGAGDRPILTIVGRLAPIKNQGLFLRMAAALRQAGRSCVFVIVGGGTEERPLKELADSLGIMADVRFLGWRDDLDRIYADSDVVVLTSNNEGTPVCLIEALAAGCAVVATDVGGVRDVLEGGRLGVMTPAGDADALAREVGRLLDDPVARAELRREGPATIPRRFGVDRLLVDVEALYDSLLGRAAVRVSPLSQTLDGNSCIIS